MEACCRSEHVLNVTRKLPLQRSLSVYMDPLTDVGTSCVYSTGTCRIPYRTRALARAAAGLKIPPRHRLRGLEERVSVSLLARHDRRERRLTEACLDTVSAQRGAKTSDGARARGSPAYHVLPSPAVQPPATQAARTSFLEKAAVLAIVARAPQLTIPPPVVALVLWA